MNRYEYICGVNPAFEVLRANRRRVAAASVCRGSESGTRFRKLVSLLDRTRIPIEHVDKGRLFKLCGSREHQGVVLHAEPYPYASLAGMRQGNRFLLLDNIEDPQNAGAILRSAEVFGWHNVLMSSRGTPAVYPSVVRASAGATEHLQIAREHSANKYFGLLAASGFSIVALDAGGTRSPHDIRTLAIGKLALVIGGEHKSVGQYILNNAAHVVAIPQRGNIGSLNASVAAGIAMFLLQEHA